MKPLLISLGFLLVVLIGAAWLRAKALSDVISNPST